MCITMARIARPERIEEQRTRLIRAAYRAVCERGFAATTLDDIARQAGMTSGIITYYFGSKEEIFLAMAEWLVMRIRDRLRAAVAAIDDPVEQLLAYLDSAFLGPEENRDYYAVYLDFVNQGMKNERFLMSNQRFYADALAIESEIIRRGVERGVFRPVEPREAARVLHALIDGLHIRWLFHGSKEDYPTHRTQCVDAVLRYLAIQRPIAE